MGWNERSDPDMRTANFCDVYREGVYNFNPYNVLLAIATNILQRLKTGFVLHARVTNVK